MSIAKRLWVAATVLALLGGTPAQASVIINEVLADPPADAAGDINKDGNRNSSEDEFVELFNNSSATQDLSGWTLADAKKARHVFPEGTTLAAQQHLVVFGGGDLANVEKAQPASSGRLDLNNMGDVITLRNRAQETVDEFVYGRIGDRGRSMVREGDASEPLLHLPNGEGLAWSPGKTNPQLDGEV